MVWAWIWTLTSCKREKKEDALACHGRGNFHGSNGRILKTTDQLWLAGDPAARAGPWMQELCCSKKALLVPTNLEYSFAGLTGS